MYLDEDTTAPAWTKADVHKADSLRPSLTPRPETLAPANEQDTASMANIVTDIDSFPDLAASCISAACNALVEAEPDLTRWDTIVGDGDCGMTMDRGAKEILSRLGDNKITVGNPVVLFRDLAEAVSASMGGTSGILFELFFRHVSTSLLGSSIGDGVVDTQALRRAFSQGIEAIAFYGGAKLGYRTMLDALVPAAQVLSSTTEDSGWDDAVRAAEGGAQGTAQILEAGAGRSTYLSVDQLKGTPDPGAMAVALAMKAVGGVLK